MHASKTRLSARLNVWKAIGIARAPLTRACHLPCVILRLVRRRLLEQRSASVPHDCSSGLCTTRSVDSCSAVAGDAALMPPRSAFEDHRPSARSFIYQNVAAFIIASCITFGACHLLSKKCE
ncbi:hypothetical protein MRX96_014641 [Rhipicephalus microplus]